MLHHFVPRFSVHSTRLFAGGTTIPTRLYSAQPATSSASRYERARIDCSSNGSIFLDIHTPPYPSSKVVIWLPSALSQLLNNSNSAIGPGGLSRSTLSTLSSAIVVQINYRLSRQVCFPTPIHDVLAGYDWIVKHVMPRHAYFSTSRHGRRGMISPNLHACGELVGGSLASMLALTECRMGSTQIGAAFVNNPIVDWVSMHEHNHTPPKSYDDPENATNTSSESTNARRRKSRLSMPSLALFSSNPDLPTSSLLSARSNLFKNPSSYFDPFASPTLFLRTPGLLASSSHDSDSASPTSFLHDDENRVANTPRKAYLRYPPSHTALHLPTFRVEMGAQSPLRDQVEEFVALLRRCHRLDRSKNEKSHQLEEIEVKDDGTGDAHKVVENSPDRTKKGSQRHPTVQELEIAKKVELRVNEGVGLWERCTEDEQMETVVKISQWLEDAIPEAL